MKVSFSREETLKGRLSGVQYEVHIQYQPDVKAKLDIAHFQHNQFNGWSVPNRDNIRITEVELSFIFILIFILFQIYFLFLNLGLGFSIISYISYNYTIMYVIEGSRRNDIILYVIHMLTLRQIYSHLEQANYSVVWTISLKYIRQTILYRVFY